MPDTEKQKIEQRLLAYCQQQGLFVPQNRVIAACSGGADSMALLLFLLHCGEQLGITPEVLHVNHGLRETARRDEEFVAEFCQKNGVPLTVFHLTERETLPEMAGEDWARRSRYACFEERAAACAGLVATAHTRNDQAETLLLRLARGTGLHGAGGIRPVRGIYRRPLLCLTRRQTEEYCRCCGQNWMEDETNFGDVYARNRVRHGALPVLETVNSAAVMHLDAFCEKMRVLDEYLNQKAQELLRQAGPAPEYRLSVLAAADAPVRRAALHLLVGQTRDPEEKYVNLLETAVLAGSGSIQLTPQQCWRAENGLLHPFNVPEPEELLPPRPLKPGIYTLPGGFRLEIGVENYENFKKNCPIHKKDLNCVADYDKIQTDIVLRTRREGDRFAPAGRGCTKSLKKYFNEQKIPISLRSRIPLLACGGQVVWLWGAGFARDLAPGEETRRVLRIVCENLPEEDVKK